MEASMIQLLHGKNKMQGTFDTYSYDLLPSGFIYPDKYLNIAKTGVDYDFLWWFIDASTDGGKLSFKCRNKIEGTNLIPFAGEGDWAAYFDGDDTSGNPKVHVLDLGNLKHHFVCKDFDDWLDQANNWYD